MIISLVSNDHGVGKSEVAKLAIRKLFFHRCSFAGNLRDAAGRFIENFYGKDEIHPVLGITRRHIVNSLSETLEGLHRDLPVYMVRGKIEELVKLRNDVIIDDTRRKSEFTWLDELATKYGTVHMVVEIMHAPGAPGSVISPAIDTWSNGKEPCGSEAWPINRTRLYNDGVPAFWDDAIVVLKRLKDEETQRQAALVE